MRLAAFINLNASHYAYIYIYIVIMASTPPARAVGQVHGGLRMGC